MKLHCHLWQGNTRSSLAIFFLLTQNKTSASVIGLYSSYATPIFLRITSGREKLIPGPFTLGRWYIPIGAVAVAWVAFINVLLCFPSSQVTSAADMSRFYVTLKLTPIYMLSTDYSVVIVGAVFIYATASWLISAHKWFTGPISNLSREGSIQEKSS